MHLALTVLLLVLSNVFMTAAWYGHLRHPGLLAWQAISVSWGLAFFEYCLQVPANRISYGAVSAYQLKILQEAITLVVFVVFAWAYLGEPLRAKHIVSFLLIFAAVGVAFSD